MARFYASINSDTIRNERTARGHEHATAHVRGWDIGGEVTAAKCLKCREDAITFHTTGGSNGRAGYPWFCVTICPTCGTIDEDTTE